MPSWTDGRAVDRGGGRRVLRPLRRFWSCRGLLWLAVVNAAGFGGARAGTEDTDRPAAARVIPARGRASRYQDDQVRVILDHVRIEDLQVLKQVAAVDILTIEILTGLDATTHYGATSTSGVIVITTTSGHP